MESYPDFLEQVLMGSLDGGIAVVAGDLWDQLDYIYRAQTQA